MRFKPKIPLFLKIRNAFFYYFGSRFNTIPVQPSLRKSVRHTCTCHWRMRRKCWQKNSILFHHSLFLLFSLSLARYSYLPILVSLELYIYLLEISRQMAARGRKSSGRQIGTGRPRMSAAGGEDRLWQTLHSMAATTTTAQSTAENTNLSIKRHQPPDNKKPGGGVGSEGWRRGGRGKRHGEKDTAREGSQKNIRIKRQISEIHADSNPWIAIFIPRKRGPRWI